jgi:hypothetical protein
MLLGLLKRALKRVLHAATEEWAIEFGLPRAVVLDMRAQRLALAQRADDEADSAAAHALGVADDDPARLEERNRDPVALRVLSAPEGGTPGSDSAGLHTAAPAPAAENNGANSAALHTKLLTPEPGGNGVAHPVLHMPSAAQVTGDGCLLPLGGESTSPAPVDDPCPAPGEGDEALLGWVQRRRDAGVASWGDLAQAATAAGHSLGGNTLRNRFWRWSQKDRQGDDDPTPIDPTDPPSAA